MRKRKQRRGMTTISLSRETVNVLKQIGRKGESYEDIIRRLIDSYLSKRRNVVRPVQKIA